MSKKILFMIFFIVMVFLPMTIANASQVYIQVQITTDEQPGGGTFDLLAGTEISIWDGGTQKGDTKILDSDVAVGETIISNLTDLENGSFYTLRLQAPLCFGGGIYDQRGPYCWYEGADGQSCNQVCLEKNSTPVPSTCYNSGTGLYDAPCCTEPDANCEISKAFGHSCSTCYNDYITGFYYSDGNACLDGSYGTSGGEYCAWSSSNYYIRTCACVFESGTFNFPFTASF